MTDSTKMICTPWRDEEEWSDTLRQLLTASTLFKSSTSSSSMKSEEDGTPESLTLADLHRSVQMVAVWRVRSDVSCCPLPHAIDVMGNLAELLMKDYLYATESSFSQSLGSMEIRLAYSSAIIRGVNGLTDWMLGRQMQQLSEYGGFSVSSLAEKLGLPSWLVDMRHDAAHNELPSLPTFRVAAMTLLNWLGDNYYLSVLQARDEQYQVGMNLLNKYASCLDSKTKNSNDHRMVKSAPTQTKLNQLRNHSKKFTKTIPVNVGHEVLLEFLLLSNKNKTNIKKVEANCPFLLAPSNDLKDIKEGDENSIFLLFQERKGIVNPLLHHVFNVWPGFYRRLVVEVIERILDAEAELKRERSPETIPSQTSYRSRKSRSTRCTKLIHELCLLFSWVQYLLSSTDIKDILWKNNNNNIPHQKQSLVSFLPIKSLSRKYVQIYKEEKGDYIRKICQLFDEVMDSEKIPRNEQSDRIGYSDETFEKVAQASKQDDVADDDNNVIQTLSLDAMEAMLSSSDDDSGIIMATKKNVCQEDYSPTACKRRKAMCGVGDQKVKDHVDRELEEDIAWTVCEEWEACPIGVLSDFVK